MGKHWAVESCNAYDTTPDYLRGDRPEDPQTAEEAEAKWRKVRRLFFMPVTVRRTTDDEDSRLLDG